MVHTLSIYDEIVELITSAPRPEAILKFKPSQTAQLRLEFLLSKNAESNLTELEKHELDQFLLVEHLMRLAKARARQRIAS